jgi:hypothetical protein
MKMVRSSVPGAVERDQAIRLLTERATLTRMVCRELLDSDIGKSDRRPQTALFQLLRWIDENMGEYVQVEPRAYDGIEQMIVPEGYQELVAEIGAGAKVCNALFMLMTADNNLQAQHDRAIIRDRLASYWAQHRLPVSVMRSIG